jgi:SAM-dependent methyltransferase
MHQSDGTDLAGQLSGAGDDRPGNSVRDSYDAVAAHYVAHVYDELGDKPMDRRLLDAVAAEAAGRGPVCDLGCGPGQVARYLHERGADVRGIDLSPRLIGEARRLNPHLRFDVADMRLLPDADASFAAVVAFYSMIHLSDDGLRQAAGEVWRILRPGGVLLTSFHRGTEPVHFDEWWGVGVDLDFRFFEPEVIENVLTGAGLVIERVIHRAPYPGVEADTQRFYIQARKQVAA